MTKKTVENIFREIRETIWPKKDILITITITLVNGKEVKLDRCPADNEKLRSIVTSNTNIVDDCVSFATSRGQHVHKVALEYIVMIEYQLSNV